MTNLLAAGNVPVSETADDTTVRLPSTRLQPVASADVAGAVAEVSTGTPLRAIWNVAGPDAHLSLTHYRDWIQTAR